MNDPGRPDPARDRSRNPPPKRARAGADADFAAVRARTLALAEPLSEEDCCVQSMPDASPVKWHLAHTTWFFETFILEKYERPFRPFNPAFRVLFNSYYNGVGEKHPRPQRGLLTRPALHEVHAYRADVDARMAALLAARGEDRELRLLTTLGLNHEQQHQELILTDVKHLLSMNPLKPAYLRRTSASPARAAPLEWLEFEGGVVEIGHDGNGFCFDNELPRHKQYLHPYRLASRLVTNGEYLRFVEDGGYGNPLLWLSEGWDWVQANAVEHPMYWMREGAAWTEFTLNGVRPLDPDLPVAHVSYFEADACARWAGARLPTEAEWEHAAGSLPVTGNLAGAEALHPRPATGPGLQQIFGDAWEWTQSSYAPYPGYRAPAGAIGEYNGKFMVNQYVLRGGSCATPDDHIRATYRNFFPAAARWQFSSVRLARDL
jgi:ergothioneine biosynthesis protein EgtB